MKERADVTVGLYLRIPPTLHAAVKRGAAIHRETITAFVQRALSIELSRIPAGLVVAQAIRDRSSRQSFDLSSLKTSE